MAGRSDISPHKRGETLMLRAMLAMPVIAWVLPIVLTMVGLPAVWIGWIVLPVGIAWLLYFGIGSLMIACPRCGRSLFMRGMFSVPWPARRCGKCGTDLTVP